PNPTKNPSKNRCQSSGGPDPNIVAPGLKGFQAARETAFADGIEDHVIYPAGFREILPGVVNHLVSAERLHQVQIGAAAHARDVRHEVLRQLNSEYADTPGGSVDEHSLPGLDLSFSEEVQRRNRSE